MVDLTKPITEATGAALAVWAKGDAPKAQERPQASLSAIVAAFKVASTMDELKRAGEAAKLLSEEDKGAAKVAYSEAINRLEKKNG
jgi:hypothetical protein